MDKIKKDNLIKIIATAIISIIGTLFGVHI